MWRCVYVNKCGLNLNIARYFALYFVIMSFSHSIYIPSIPSIFAKLQFPFIDFILAHIYICLLFRYAAFTAPAASSSIYRYLCIFNINLVKTETKMLD